MKPRIMNCYLHIGVACFVTAFIGGCGTSRPGDIPGRQLDDATFNAGLDPSDTRILAFVESLKQKGVTLESIKNAEGEGGNWKVIQPRTSDEYVVIFSIRSFPSWASEAQMLEALDVNLAYVLNARAHLAMSYAMISGTHPDTLGLKSDEELPKVNGVPVTTAVEQLFKQYQPD